MPEVEFETIEEDTFSFRKIFRWKNTDKYIVRSVVVSTFAVWVYFIFNKKFSNLMTYGDAPTILYVSNHLYKRPEDKNYFNNCGSNIENASNADFLGVSPGVPIVIFILRHIFMGYWTPAFVVYILVTNIICGILFERFLSEWHLVHNSVLTASLLSIFPMRFISMHSSLCTETLYLSCVFVALIGYKANRFDVILYSTIVAGIFDRQGIALSMAFIINFFIRSNYEKAAKIFLAKIGVYFAIGVVQSVQGNTPFGYVLRNYVAGADIAPFPFSYFLWTAMSIASMEPFHIEWLLYAGSVISIMIMSRYSFMFVIFPAMTLIYTSLFCVQDLLKVMVVLEVFTILVGFDTFFNSPGFKRWLPLFFIIYGVFGIVMAINSIEHTCFYNEDYFWKSL